MHKYLRAVGFSKTEKTADLNELLYDVVKNYDSKKVVAEEDGRQFAQFTKEFAPDCGVCVCGEYNDDGDFNIEHHFPFLSGSGVSATEEVFVERRADNEAYIGACDDLRFDISIIFHLINIADYLAGPRDEFAQGRTSPVLLSALCTDGKILLPVVRTEAAVAERQKKLQKRTALIMAAKNGSEEAMEDLTVDDMDVYNEISRRVGSEDLYSIVDNCFMPYGFGNDMYSLIGDITGFARGRNSRTGEALVKLNILCNGITLDVCMNEADLTGEPAVGRRFKGVIWLQGIVDFEA